MSVLRLYAHNVEVLVVEDPIYDVRKDPGENYTCITIGPILSKPNHTGSTVPVSGVVVDLIPTELSFSKYAVGNGFSTGTTDASGRVALVWPWDSRSNIKYRLTYPAGTYDSDLPESSKTIEDTLFKI